MTKLLAIGGQTKNFHQFHIVGPIIEAFLSDAGFDVHLTDDRDQFTAENMKAYDAVVDFTTRGTLTEEQEDGLLQAIIRGKGYIGVHGCTSDKGVPAYHRMIGGKFLTHPPIQELRFHVCDTAHPITQGIQDFAMNEEMYLMEVYGDRRLLMTANYNGFTHPITWVKPYGLGRVFYTTLGHGEEQLNHATVQTLIVNAVYWALQTER